jgi:hypothetical protein
VSDASDRTPAADAEVDEASRTPDDSGSVPEDSPADTDGSPGDAARESAGTDASASEDGPGRDVAVPMRLYKTVTVVSTLLAMAGVVGGFVLLDSATNRATASLAEVDTLGAVVGVALIAGGALTYAYATRFRAAEMGQAQDDGDATSDDG